MLVKKQHENPYYTTQQPANYETYINYVHMTILRRPIIRYATAYDRPYIMQSISHTDQESGQS